MSASQATATIPPRGGGRQADRTARSDQRMLDAAIRLIVVRGTEKTTLKAVGEEAGYSRGLAGYRFGSKGGLFRFVVKAIGEEWLAALKRVTADLSGAAAIEAATEAHYRFCVEAPDHVRAFYILWFESIGPASEYRDVIAGIHARRRRDVAEWIRQGKELGLISPRADAKVEAAQFCAGITGIVYQWLVEPEDLVELKTMFDALKRTMQLRLASGDRA